MLIFMAAMVLLYFIGVIVSYFVVRRKRARAVAAGGA
jgi:Sec-independent protein secretion pathway component TatC